MIGLVALAVAQAAQLPAPSITMEHAKVFADALPHAATLRELPFSSRVRLMSTIGVHQVVPTLSAFQDILKGCTLGEFHPFKDRITREDSVGVSLTCPNDALHANNQVFYSLSFHDGFIVSVNMELGFPKLSAPPVDRSSAYQSPTILDRVAPNPSGPLDLFLVAADRDDVEAMRELIKFAFDHRQAISADNFLAKMPYCHLNRVLRSERLQRARALWVCADGAEGSIDLSAVIGNETAGLTINVVDETRSPFKPSPKLRSAAYGVQQ